MRRRLRRSIPSAVGPAVAALLLLGCQSWDGGGEADEGALGAEMEEHDEHGGEGDREDLVELSPEAIARAGLLTVPAGLERLVARRAMTGRVDFDETHLAHVGSRVPGRVVRVEAELGDRVGEGETLALIDSVELGQARAGHLRARAREEVAQRRFERERSLHVDRISSEQDVLEAEAAAREAAADLAVTRETLLLLGLSEEEILGLFWDQAGAAVVAVRAPFAGRVVAKEATRGELVTPERTLFTVADLGVVWVWIDVYERDLRHVGEGDTVEVELDAWPGETFTGKLTYLADQLDTASRTVRARVDLPNPDGRLKPGMFARVMLTASGEAEGEPAVVVPRDAVQRLGEAAIVFVRAGITRFERREVELGQVVGDLVEVRAGIAAGEEVVTEGAFLLRSEASSDDLGGHHH